MLFFTFPVKQGASVHKDFPFICYFTLCFFSILSSALTVISLFQNKRYEREILL